MGLLHSAMLERRQILGDCRKTMVVGELVAQVGEAAVALRRSYRNYEQINIIGQLSGKKDITVSKPRGSKRERPNVFAESSSA